jgi:hypothetical protein
MKEEGGRAEENTGRDARATAQIPLPHHCGALRESIRTLRSGLIGGGASPTLRGCHCGRAVTSIVTGSESFAFKSS